MKSQNKVISTDLMGVAQERYFYKLVDFSQEDITFLDAHINSSYAPSIIPLIQDFLLLYKHYSLAKKGVEDNKNPAVDEARAREMLREVEINSLELIHGKVEHLGDRLVECRCLEDIESLDYQDETRDDLLDAITFLCIQYFRTRSSKDAAIAAFPPSWAERVEKYWNITSFGMALALARNIISDPNQQYCFIDNTTLTPFLTSDQPVFNLRNDEVNASEEVTALELYYPLSPQHALLIRFTTSPDASRPVQRFELLAVQESQVEYYNQKVVDNSHTYIFANNDSQLRKLVSI